MVIGQQVYVEHSVKYLPYHDNTRCTLDYDKKDKWGLPTVTFDAKIRENEIAMRKDMKAAG